MYGLLLFLESIPLPKACASHIENILSKSPETYKMDGTEKLLSISQCQTTVVYSVTVLVQGYWKFCTCTKNPQKKTQEPICLFEVTICLIEVPICLGTEMSHTGADLSRCRSV